MKVFASIAAAVAVQSLTVSAFVASPQCQQRVVASTTARSMGLFDFFSEEARKEREERKQREIEEQERLQREIIARRSNPQKMEEYEAKVRVRRQLRSKYKTSFCSHYTAENEHHELTIFVIYLVPT